MPPATASAASGVHTLTPPSLELQPGDSVGEYVVVDKLGEGGFGAVYEVAHPLIGKRAAVKVLHAQYSSDPGVTGRFVAEARAVNQIHHRNIVDIFSFGDLPDGRHFYVMELLEGVALDTYLERAKRLPLDEALGLLCPIAKAITAAHEAEIVHRDLKPENVFLEIDEDGHVHPKILDFGMAKLLSDVGPTASQTRSGAPIGSPRYMSPEQCRGVSIDQRADIYALGCIAYRMLVGTPPFEATTVLELMMAQVSLPPTIPSSRCPELDPSLDQPLLRMLEKEPASRPKTAWLAYESLAKARAPGSAPPASVVTLSPSLRELWEERKARRSALIPQPRRAARLRPVPRVASTAARVVGLLAVATLMGFVGAVAGWFHLPSSAQTPRTSYHPQSTPSLPSPSVTATQPPASPEPPEVPSVRLTVRSQPSQAELFWGDDKVGTKSGTLLVARSATTATLSVRAPGYVPARIPVIPSADQTVNVTLVPRITRPAASVPGDLEDPYQAP
jgi:eukaryotic-like serine/threonine-protein kinase